jgi:hypothetical protein
MGTISSKQDIKVNKMASRAANLQIEVQAVWMEKDIETKKLLAIKLAESFELGGKEKFIESIRTAPNAATIDRIAANAMLKGEGMSTKRF